MNKKFFINFSNHPSEKWEEKQMAASQEYGEIMDYPFPAVPAMASKFEVERLAEDCVEKIRKCNPAAVLCQGEFTLTYQVVTRLKACGILVLAACSERKVIEEKGIKVVEFQFQQYREY